MVKTQELFTEAAALPADIRLQLVEFLLRSLHPTRQEIDVSWADEVEQRVDDIALGKVKTIPGEEVFRKIRQRLKT